MGVYMHEVSDVSIAQQSQGLYNLASGSHQYTAIGISPEAFQLRYGNITRRQAQEDLMCPNETHYTLGLDGLSNAQIVGMAYAVSIPSVLRARTLSPLRFLPWTHERIPDGPVYLAGITEQDAHGENLLEAMAQMLGKATMNRLVDPAYVFRRESVPLLAMTVVADGQPDYLYYLLREKLRMKELKAGHFAVKFADGAVDKELLERSAKLYATTEQSGELGVKELHRYLPPHAFGLFPS